MVFLWELNVDVTPLLQIDDEQVTGRLHPHVLTPECNIPFSQKVLVCFSLPSVVKRFGLEVSNRSDLENVFIFIA
jgi:hypothetical protein